MLLWEGQKGRENFPFSKCGQGAPSFDAPLALPLGYSLESPWLDDSNAHSKHGF